MQVILIAFCKYVRIFFMKTDAHNGKRSDCPVNFAVETLGDKWSLVILRDMIFWGKHTYGEFLKSDERIATNILAGRLEYLENEGLITKAPHPSDKRKEFYNVTEKAIELVPMLIEMIVWSARQETWQTMEHSGTIEQIRFVERAVKTQNKSKLIKEVSEIVRRGECVFEGVIRPE
jgi:DNA-binding HxlR family transcriptional regulator